LTSFCGGKLARVPGARAAAIEIGTRAGIGAASNRAQRVSARGDTRKKRLQAAADIGIL